MDGCSEELAVLKQTRLVPSNSFMSPTVYTLVVEERAPVSVVIGHPKWRFESCLSCFCSSALFHIQSHSCLPKAVAPLLPQTGSYLLFNEGTVIGTSDTPQASSTPAALSDGNDTASNLTTMWFGCILANMPAVLNGDVLTTLDGIASPEACCRECRARAPACNVWNGCWQQEECRQACDVLQQWLGMPATDDVCDFASMCHVAHWQSVLPCQLTRTERLSVRRRFKDLSQEIVLQPGQCEHWPSSAMPLGVPDLCWLAWPPRLSPHLF
jgi:hypothetical protein